AEEQVSGELAGITELVRGARLVQVTVHMHRGAQNLGNTGTVERIHQQRAAVSVNSATQQRTTLRGQRPTVNGPISSLNSVQDVKETLSSLRTTSSGANALRGRRSQNVKAGARRGSAKNGFVKLRSQRTRKAAQQLRVQVVCIPTELVRHGHNHGHRVTTDVLAREGRPRNRLLVSLINPVGNNVTGQQRNAETRTGQRNRRSKLRNG